jgi:Putative peptidoglycan binding domain
MPINHTVEDGDSVISLSEEHGLFALTIWDHPANAGLRQQRTDMNVLMPGDVVFVPDKRIKLEKRPTGARHRFRRKGIPALFRLQVFDVRIPRRNEKYILTVDGIEIKGTTDNEGILEHYIPAQARQGELVIGEDEFRLTLQFGYLDPLNEISGIQKRLANMGYDCGEPDGTLNEATKQALIEFQRDNELERTGELDAATKDKLLEVHDNPYLYPEEDGAPATGGTA